MSRFITRRNFMRGLGGYTLALPLLPSLLPNQAEAAFGTPAKKIIMIISRQGIFPDVYFPSVEVPRDRLPIAGGYVPLDSISGTMSPYFGSRFDKYRSKMNILRGLDLIARQGHNEHCVLSCTAGPRVAPQYGVTFDTLIAQSSNFYSKAPAIPALRIQSPRGTGKSFGWKKNKTTGASERVTFAREDSDLFTYIFEGRDLNSNSTDFEKKKANKLLIGDLLLTEYKRILSRLPNNEKIRLESHVDGLHNLKAEINKSEIRTCATPNLNIGGGKKIYDYTNQDWLKYHFRYNEMMTRALSCGLTQLVVYDPKQWEWHTHDKVSNVEAQNKWLGIYNHQATVVLDLLERLDSTLDVDGSKLLDNTLVLWTHEITTGTHVLRDHPVITFGDVQGQLRTGYYVDYGNRPLNQLAVTVMKAMGLKESDFNPYGDGGGFGQFNPAYSDYPRTNRNNETRWNPYQPDRNKALPFIWKT